MGQVAFGLSPDELESVVDQSALSSRTEASSTRDQIKELLDEGETPPTDTGAIRQELGIRSGDVIRWGVEERKIVNINPVMDGADRDSLIIKDAGNWGSTFGVPILELYADWLNENVAPLT